MPVDFVYDEQKHKVLLKQKKPGLCECAYMSTGLDGLAAANVLNIKSLMDYFVYHFCLFSVQYDRLLAFITHKVETFIILCPTY